MLVGRDPAQIHRRSARSAGGTGLAGENRRGESRRHRFCKSGIASTPALISAAARSIEIAQLADARRRPMSSSSTTIFRPARSARWKRSSTKQAAASRGEGIKVLDRSELILDIFATRAQTARSQAAGGTGTDAIHLSAADADVGTPGAHRRRRAGWHRHARAGRKAIGNRPPTRAQTHQPISSDEIDKIQDRKVAAGRASERASISPICIVGYTNAGKSTLFNTLTAAGTYADDKLFATLDTKTRAWKLERGHRSAAERYGRIRARSAAQSGRQFQGDAGGSGACRSAAACAGCRPSARRAAVRIGASGSGRDRRRDKPEILLLNKIDTESANLVFRNGARSSRAIPISAKTGRESNCWCPA